MRYIPDSITGLYMQSPGFIRDLASTVYGIYKTRKERNSDFNRSLREIREAFAWDRDHLEEVQLERLRNIFRHAIGTVPFYRELYTKNGLDSNSIRSLSDIRKLPVISKEDVRLNLEGLRSLEPTPLQMVQSTSGTTGKPMRFEIDRSTEAYHNAVKQFVKELAGVSPGWFGVMAGIRILPPSHPAPPFWIQNHFNRQVHYSSYHLNKSTFRYYEDHMREKKIRYLDGYPTSIGMLARFMLDEGRTMKLDAVISSSQPVQEWSRNAIEEAFQCQIYEFYALAERNIWGISTGKDTNLVIADPLCIMEINADAGQEGNIIATGLTNYRMPILRYEIDDISSLVDTNPARYGTSWSCISAVKSRRGDYIITPSGKKLAAPVFTIAFWGEKGIVESQVHQTGRDTIIVRIIPSIGFSPLSAEKIRENISGVTGHEMEVRIELCDNLVEGKTGKKQYIMRSYDP